MRAVWTRGCRAGCRGCRRVIFRERPKDQQHTPKYRYEICSCSFRFGNVRMAVAACDSGGGRCSGKRTLPPNATLTNRQWGFGTNSARFER
jgi:hypothetical protein